MEVIFTVIFLGLLLSTLQEEVATYRIVAMSVFVGLS